MGFPDALAQAQAQSQVTAPQVAPTPDATAKKGDSRNAEIKAKGEAIIKSLSEEEKAAQGQKSNTIKFVNTIGHAGIKVTRSKGSESITSNKTIGYKLQNVGDAPIQVPVAPYKSSNVAEATLPPTYRTVQPGETFVVNLVEAGILVSQPEYAGKFTGEGIEARFSPKAQKDSMLPLVTFKVAGGSSKDNMELIGGDKDAEGNVILPEEFKGSFTEVFKKKRAPRATATQKEDTFAINAAAFRAFVAEASK